MKYLKKFEMFAQPGEDEGIALEILDAIEYLFRKEENIQNFISRINNGYEIILGDRPNSVNCRIRKEGGRDDYSGRYTYRYELKMNQDVLDVSENLKEKIWTIVSNKWKEKEDKEEKGRKEMAIDKFSLSRKEGEKFNI